MNTYDAIVVGSGVSGLTAALILAKEGQRVALFEKDRDINPLIRPYKRKGCECSPGLHISGWMDEGEVVASFLKYLNLSDGVEKELNENGFGDVIIGSDRYHFPRGFDNVEKSLLSYFPESAAAIRNYMGQVKEANERAFYINHKLAAGADYHSRFDASDHFTLKDCLKQYHASPKLIDTLGMFNYVLMGSKADEVPFKVHAFVLGGFYQSPGFFTINGINRLLSNFQRELARFRVRLYTNSEIAEVLIGSSRNAVGVKTVSGDQYFAPNIIVSFNPKSLNEKIKPNTLRPIYRRRLDEAENTFGFYVAFYKLADDENIEIENLIYYNDNLNMALGATVNRSGGNQVLSVFLSDPDPMIFDDPEERTKRAERKLELLESVIYEKLPDLRGKLTLLDYLKPWSFERYTSTINGSAYGIKQTSNSIGFQHKVPIHGLYLVGQSIYPGYLGAMISSFSLAMELFESNEFWPRVTNQ